MIVRRTPLKRSTKRLKRTPLKRSRKLLPARGPKAKREAAALERFRERLFARSGGQCERRTPACRPGSHPGSDAHHIRPADRDIGVHDPAYGLFLCRAAHRWVHANPTAARMRGLLLRSGETV